MIPEHKKIELRKKYIASGCWRNETFGEMLHRLSRQYGKHTALKAEYQVLSYEELDSLVEKCARYFYDIGLRSGDKAIIQLPNSLALFIVSFGFFRLGVLPVLTLPAHREREIGNFIQKTSAKAYVFAEKHLGFSYLDMAKAVTANTGCRTFTESALMKILLSDTVFPEYVASAISPYNPAVLLVSGGTTGIPKLIPRTHADYLYDAETFARIVGMNQETRFLAAIPAAHNFTFANPGVIGTFLSGGTAVLSRNGSADEILDLIDEEKIDITSLVPSLVSLCASMAEWDDPERFRSLKTILVGGAVLQPDVLTAAEKNLTCKVRQVFGTAEGLNTITPDNLPSKEVAACQGIPISEYDEMQIIDENGNVMETNVLGELILRGPYTILNYFENEEADREAFLENGFYRTGDKGYIDDNGCLHICGRIREQINKSGEKIMPYELETLIKSMERILDVAVIGIPDKEKGNTICACIICDGLSVSIKEIREYMLSKGTAAYKLPDHVFEIESIPLTGLGKPDKNRLLKMFMERND